MKTSIIALILIVVSMASCSSELTCHKMSEGKSKRNNYNVRMYRDLHSNNHKIDM